METARKFVTTRRVVGESVFSSSGAKLGKIEDLMIEKASGKVLYALLAFDGFLGMGQKYYPTPWAMLDYNTAIHAFVIPLTHAQLEGAHAIADDEVEKEIEWRELVHTFYGATPYWPGAIV
jgi:hypothetical protein